VDKAFQFAAARKCDTVTVASAMANVGFYEKCGFSIGGRMVELDMATKAYDVDIVKNAASPQPVGFHAGPANACRALSKLSLPRFRAA